MARAAVLLRPLGLHRDLFVGTGARRRSPAARRRRDGVRRDRRRRRGRRCGLPGDPRPLRRAARPRPRRGRQHPRSGRDRAGRRSFRAGLPLRRGAAALGTACLLRPGGDPPAAADAWRFERGARRSLAVAAGGTGLTPVLCRDCGGLATLAAIPERCGECGSPRLVAHAELADLAIAHIDCDAFYATVEKRDRPDLAERPVIVGGGTRGVVLACCYVARLYGVRSAMPMFKALAACPDAVVIRPDMAKYSAVGREVRAEMRRLTPLVEPLSIDEAFLNLGGTGTLHEACPAQLLAGLAKRVETAHGITVSIGLSDNKFLAKIASDLDKPRGFAVLSRSEAPAFLAGKPVSLLWGVGTAMQRRLAGDGITLIGQLAEIGGRELASRYGRMGA